MQGGGHLPILISKPTQLLNSTPLFVCLCPVLHFPLNNKKIWRYLCFLYLLWFNHAPSLILRCNVIYLFQSSQDLNLKQPLTGQWRLPAGSRSYFRITNSCRLFFFWIYKQSHGKHVCCCFWSTSRKYCTLFSCIFGKHKQLTCSKIPVAQSFCDCHCAVIALSNLSSMEMLFESWS